MCEKHRHSNERLMTLHPTILEETDIRQIRSGVNL